MKKIKSKRRLFMGIILCLLAVVCGVLALAFGPGMRYWVSAGVLLALSGVNCYYAFQKHDLTEEIVARTDERDRFIAMKSCQSMVQIVNYVLLGGTLLSLVLYGGIQDATFLIVAVTLCSVLVLMFGVTLAANVYYGKRECR